MSLNSANCDDIKRAIFDELTRTLLNPGPDPEERLKQLKYTEGTTSISFNVLFHKLINCVFTCRVRRLWNLLV